MKISKHAIKEIVATAPYRPGDYFDPGPRGSWASLISDTHPGSNCIVGALIRTYAGPDVTVSGAYKLAERLTQGVGCSFSPRSVAKRGNYLGALSAHFENITTLTDNMVTPDVREEMVSFIDKHFPDFIELSFETMEGA